MLLHNRVEKCDNNIYNNFFVFAPLVFSLVFVGLSLSCSIFSQLESVSKKRALSLQSYDNKRRILNVFF